MIMTFMFAMISAVFAKESYFRADIGSTKWMLNRPAPWTTSVLSNEFVLGRSIGWMNLELSYRTDVWNGISYDMQPEYIPANLYFQGDSRMNSLLLGIRQDFLKKAKVKAGYRCNIGASVIPVLMDEATYDTIVVAGRWGLTASPNHREVYIPVTVGGYVDVYRFYDTLAAGINLDVLYVVGWDAGMRTSFSLSSTF